MLPSYIIRPLTDEARQRVKGVERSRDRFDTTWSMTQYQLRAEVEKLDPRYDEFVMLVDVDERGIRNDGQLRADARPTSPIVGITVDSATKGDLLFVCGAFHDWQANVRAIALGLESLRRVERYGIVQSDEQYRGFKAIGSGIAMPPATMTKDEAERILLKYAVGPVLDSKFINWEVLYRRGAKELHPDAGGDPDAFRILTLARDLVLA